MKTTVVISSLLLLCSTLSAAENKVVFLDGHASGSRSGVLRKDSTVQTGETLKTAAHSSVRIAIGDDIVVEAGPESEFTVEAEKQGISAVRLAWGKLLSVVRPALSQTDRYQVKTKDATMGVRGTVFFVAKEKEKPTFTCICKGKVSLTAQGATKLELFESKHHDMAKTIAGARVSDAKEIVAHKDTDVEAWVSGAPRH